MKNWKTVAIRAPAMVLLMTAVSTAWGQGYPSKTVRIATGGPGSAGDLMSRLIAPGLTASLGQQVIVENRPSGVILGEGVAGSAPDGHTLMVTGSSFWLAPFVLKSVPWDPVRDFVPITLAVSSPNMIVVHPSLPVKTVKELIALAKARPGQLNYASGTTGSMPHLGAELFKARAGVDIVRINYRGQGAALIDTISGQMHLMFPNAGGAAQHVKSGRLRLLAVTTERPSALFPGIPTVSASGLPGFDVATGNGIFAPARTPDAIIARLNQEIVRALNAPNVKQKLFGNGVEIIGSPPEQLAATIQREFSQFRSLLSNETVRAN